MTELRYTFPGNADEYVSAGSIAARELPSERKARRLLAFGAPAVAALLWAASIVMGGFGALAWLFPFAMLWFPLFTLIGLPWIVRRQLRAAAAADPALRGELTRVLGDGALLASAPEGGRSEIPWSSVTEVLETEEYWIFMIAPRGMAYIPKHATGAAEDDRIRVWLTAKLGGRVRQVAPRRQMNR